MLQRAYAQLPSDKALVDELLALADGDPVLFCLSIAVAATHGDAAKARLAAQGNRTGVACMHCGALGTVSVTLAQARSADEGETAFMRCSACGRHWRD